MSWLYKRLTKAWARAKPQDGFRQASKAAARSFLAVSKLKKIGYICMALAVLLLIGGAVAALWQAGDGDATVLRQGKPAATVEADAPVVEDGAVPVARLDTAGSSALDVERLDVADPQSVEATVTLGRGENAPTLVWREQDPWFPEMRPPAAGIDTELLCPPGVPAACDSMGVAVTPRARPFVELDAAPMLGLTAPPGDLSAPSGYAGLDVLRFGPLHLGAGMSARIDSAGTAAGLSPKMVGTASVMLRDDLFLMCSRDAAVSLDAQWSCGAALRF
jgi:hypothetical protein